MPYIPFTEEQKITANTVDLPEYLKMRGEHLERAGREYKLIYNDGGGKHDSITMSADRWFDHKKQVGGGPIKFMQYYYGMNFQNAVQALLGYSVETFSRIAPKKAEKTEEKKVFTLPPANSDMHRVYAYLIKQRYISADVITHFVRKKTLYEEAGHHNVVFVGTDENGVPKQASKRSTVTFGSSFRMTCEGSDTRYSFSQFGESSRIYVFEAPIDMLSFLTLFPDNRQLHSYIALNGVYENALITALKNHSNLREIYLCLDNDEGGIEALDRLKDILYGMSYTDIRILAPQYKDWNEMLKARNGADALPAVPHKRRETYRSEVMQLREISCSAGQIMSRVNAALNNSKYKSVAEYAVAGSAFFMRQAGYTAGFRELCIRTCTDNRMRTSFRQIFMLTASKDLAIRKYSCVLFPCQHKNYARKSVHNGYRYRF